MRWKGPLKTGPQSQTGDGSPESARYATRMGEGSLSRCRRIQGGEISAGSSHLRSTHAVTDACPAGAEPLTEKIINKVRCGFPRSFGTAGLGHLHISGRPLGSAVGEDGR